MSEYSKKSFIPSCIQGRTGGLSPFFSFILGSACALGQQPAIVPLQDGSQFTSPPLASPSYSQLGGPEWIESANDDSPSVNNSGVNPSGVNSTNALDYAQYYGAETFEAPTEWPRIKSLGKLVSIEGKAGDPGSLREFGDTAMSRSNTATGLPFDSDSTSELQLPKLSYFSSEPYLNYRSDEESISYLPGDGDNFGWLSFESSPYVRRGYHSGFTTAFNMHLLSGPNAFPLPPRLYDFSLGYQRRKRLGDILSYDVAASVGVFSDFEDSARDGVRFPGHAVGMLHLKPELDWVFGVDYVSRDDIKLLPVAGVSWRPQAMPDMRFDLVFPRPRIDYAIDNQSKLYMAGRLGGGTWDIEFPNNDNDVMTYRDLQLLFGYENRGDEGNSTAVELGYVFDRRVQFRTLSESAEFDNAFVLRIVTRK